MSTEHLHDALTRTLERNSLRVRAQATFETESKLLGAVLRTTTLVSSVRRHAPRNPHDATLVVDLAGWREAYTSGGDAPRQLPPLSRQGALWLLDLTRGVVGADPAGTVAVGPVPCESFSCSVDVMLAARSARGPAQLIIDKDRCTIGAVRRTSLTIAIDADGFIRRLSAPAQRTVEVLAFDVGLPSDWRPANVPRGLRTAGLEPEAPPATATTHAAAHVRAAIQSIKAQGEVDVRVELGTELPPALRAIERGVTIAATRSLHSDGLEHPFTDAGSLDFREPPDPSEDFYTGRWLFDAAEGAHLATPLDEHHSTRAYCDLTTLGDDFPVPPSILTADELIQLPLTISFDDHDARIDRIEYRRDLPGGVSFLSAVEID